MTTGPASGPRNDAAVTSAGVRLSVQSPPLSLRQRAVGAYLGLAVGDALGATTEFMTSAEIRNRYGVHREIVGGGWLRLPSGRVTDDTEMSLALGDAILAQGGIEPSAIADAFLAWMRGKPVDIGNTVRRGLVRYRSSGVPCVERSDDLAGNGACMRCLPIALAYWRADRATLCAANRAQAHITHNAPLSDAGTEAVLDMLVAALQGAPLADLEAVAEALVQRCAALGCRQFDYRRRRIDNPSGWIVETLQVVFQALFDNTGFEAVVVDAVNRGGDADTTGAIAGMLAGAYYGLPSVPARWRRALDRDVARACERQALALLALAEQGARPPVSAGEGGS